MKRRNPKPPKRWVPPSDEVMKRLFPGLGGGGKVTTQTKESSK